DAGSLDAVSPDTAISDLSDSSGTLQIPVEGPTEQENDISPTQDTEATADTEKPVDPKRLEAETEILAHNMLLRRIATLTKGKTDAEIAQMSAQDGGFRKLMSLEYLQTMGEGLRSQGKNGEMINGIDLSRGDPLTITHDGSEYRITLISKGEGDNLI